jgi:hypothetical protein
MNYLRIALCLIALTGLTGCVALQAVRTTVDVAGLYLATKKDPIVINYPDCAVSPIVPDEGFENRWTENEIIQADELALDLEELCKGARKQSNMDSE